MYFNLANDWPALIVVAVFLFFVVYVYIASRKNDKTDKDV